jgi:hypothetical protein
VKEPTSHFAETRIGGSHVLLPLKRMRKLNHTLYVLCLMFLCLSVQAAGKSIYTWTDENGVVYFSEVPPSDPSVKPKRMYVPEGPGSRAVPAEEEKEPAGEQAVQDEPETAPEESFCGYSETRWSEQFAEAREKAETIGARLEKYREALEEGKKAAGSPRFRVEGRAEPLHYTQFLKEITTTEEKLEEAQKELKELERRANLCNVPATLRQ